MDIIQELTLMLDNPDAWAHAHPRWGYAIAVVLLLIWLFGIVRGWKWTYESSTWKENSLRQALGDKAWRCCIGALLVVALVCLLYLLFR